MAVLLLRTLIAAPVEDVFDLSLDIDEHAESMRGHAERAVAGVTSGRIGDGQTVTWRARHFGLTWSMTSAISEVARPRRFVDEQVSGPFRRWHHEHLFVATPGGTSMIDRIEYQAPLRPLGILVERAVLTDHLRRLVLTRNVHLKRRLEG